ncbi:MAG: hypothetical protein V4739_03640 [Pseudomonadota bacterium]
MLKKLSSQPALTLLFTVLALGFIALAVAGGARTFSPVPFWDMWDGYVDFHGKVTGGEVSAWWAQHNEHRIVLSRLLFWADITWFGGTTRFLLVVNYLLLGVTGWVFWTAWRELAGGKDAFVGLFLAAWLFSWSQEDNLLWAFQSQFILAQLVPLLAFYCLHRAASSPTPSPTAFAGAALLGIASIGTMANGVLTLPLMTLYAVLVRESWRRVVVLAVLSCLCLGVYFHDYVPPAGHGSLALALRDNPLGVAAFILLYLGGPFAHFWPEGGAHARHLALGSGTFFVLSAVFLAWRTVPHARHHTLAVALLTFVLYIGGSALGTAGGRLMFGLDQALTSRYTTPSLMAWAALCVLMLSRFSAQSRVRRTAWIFLLLVLLAMVPRQRLAIDVAQKKQANFERWIAALALEMRVRDEAQIRQVYPDANRVLAVAEAPVRDNLVVFGLAPLKDLGKTLGVTLAPLPTRPCTGAVDAVQPVPGDRRFFRVTGWFYDPQRQVSPHGIRFVDAANTGVGAALSGQSRPDVARAVGRRAHSTGFVGYVLADSRHQALTLVDVDAAAGAGGKGDAKVGCRLTLQMPASVFHVNLVTPGPTAATVSVQRLQPAHQWQGSDYLNSRIDDMVVLGSRRTGDADTGALTLNLRRGDQLLYRSGPTGGQQFVEVMGEPASRSSLPIAPDWVQLDFSTPALAAEFPVTFTDAGTGWGEWSAIAIRSK